MSVLRPVLVAVLLIGVSPLQAAFTLPECDSLERWTAGFDQRDRVRIAPQIEMPSLLQDRSLSSLFGKPLFGWSKRQFREVVAQLDRCGERAAQKGDRVAASSLTAVSGEIDRMADLTRDYGQAVHRVEKAVQQLEIQPPSQELVLAMSLAIDALHHENVRSRAEGLPHEQQRALVEIMIGADYLPDKPASRFVKQLERQRTEVSRKAEEEAARAEASRSVSEMTPEERRAERERAYQVVQEASARIDSATADNAGLLMLQGMLQLPALQMVPADEKQAFIDRVSGRYNELSLTLRQVRETASQRMAEERLKALYAMRAASLEDLGKLLAYRNRVRQSLRQQGQPQAVQIFEEGFQPYFEQKANKLMPDFKAALRAIPADASGLAKLDTLVGGLTGMAGRAPYLDSYYSLVEKRREELRGEGAR